MYSTPTNRSFPLFSGSYSSSSGWSRFTAPPSWMYVRLPQWNPMAPVPGWLGRSADVKQGVIGADQPARTAASKSWNGATSRRSFAIWLAADASEAAGAPTAEVPSGARVP